VELDVGNRRVVAANILSELLLDPVADHRRVAAARPIPVDLLRAPTPGQVARPVER